MKNVKKTLTEKLQKVEAQFNELEKKRQANVAVIQQAQTDNNNIVPVLLRLQGEYTSLTELLKDFQDEPNENKK